MQSGQQFTECIGRIGDGAAIHAAVQIVTWAGEEDFAINQAAQTISDGGIAAGELAGVADEGDIRFQIGLVVL